MLYVVLGALLASGPCAYYSCGPEERCRDYNDD